MAKKKRGDKRHSANDFTGGLIDQMSCQHCGTTGDIEIDKKLISLAASIEHVKNPELLAEMMTTTVRIARGNVTVGDFKLINRALKEMLTANEVFHHYDDHRKVAIFGSARTDPEHPAYQSAVKFAETMADEGFMGITGAGPGIMAAGNEGAGRENSFGLNISLPFENTANEFIHGDEKLVDFNYFFTRKLSFVKEADALACFPGGFGTMDEAFEALTLIQTGKASIYPTVMVDAPGGDYWKIWDDFVKNQLLANGLISEADLSLYKVTDDIDVAVAEILQFYKNFHSYRYIGDRLVFRLQKELTDQAVEQLNSDFSSILKSGEIRKSAALKWESNQPELADMPRLVFRHKRRDYGKLRQFIDALNAAETVSK